MQKENYMAKAINPFIVTGKIAPEYFCDRVNESARLVKSITNGNNLVIISPRRMGKTGLIQFCYDKPEISKEYYTLITDTLRKYIEERFGINAMEMTSGEILDLIRKNSEAQSVYDNLRQILQLADFVKFAKMNPLPDENDLSMMNAYLFVNQTKEEEMVELVDSPLSDELTASGQEERQPAVKAVDSPLSNEPVAPCQDDLTRYQPKSTNDTTNLKD